MTTPERISATFTTTAQYEVRLSVTQALRALLGQRIILPGRQVSPLAKFGVGTSTVTIEAYGSGGGGGSYIPENPKEEYSK